MTTKRYFIGLMSGTSVDGIDAALIAMEQGTIKLVAYHEAPWPQDVAETIHQLCHSEDINLNLLGQTHRQLGMLFAQAAIEVMHQAQLQSADIEAIGSHGQTIRHFPKGSFPFSMQIGDPHTIACLTNIDVIADFRSKDIALGGQGAPLVPAFHRKMFFTQKTSRFIVNIGGIANITYLPSQGQILGFDSGPGNTLMDLWARKQLAKPYDQDGQFARQGKPHSPLLHHFLTTPYFALPSPKSTGRELFNTAWLETHLASFKKLNPADIQATLLELTCHTIANEIKKIAPKGEVFVCGGGALNTYLLQSLQQHLPNHPIDKTDRLGIASLQVEAVAFAWLAACFKDQKTSNEPQVTGAQRQAILGAFFPTS
jgi:anhydro-N-acetylmuramic acid kinase